MKIPGEKLSSENISEIMSLFKQGLPMLRIAQQFNRHHSTIIYHIRRNLAKEEGTPLVKRTIPKRAYSPSDHTESRGRVFVFAKKVKTYDDYEEEERARRFEKQEKCSHFEMVMVIRCRDCGKTKEEHIRINEPHCVLK